MPEFTIITIDASFTNATRFVMNRAVNQGDRIRTCDLRLPKPPLYQAELRPAECRWYPPRARFRVTAGEMLPLFSKNGALPVHPHAVLGA